MIIPYDKTNIEKDKIRYNRFPIPKGWLLVRIGNQKVGEYIISYTTGNPYLIEKIMVEGYPCLKIIVKNWIWLNTNS